MFLATKLKSDRGLLARMLGVGGNRGLLFLCKDQLCLLILHLCIQDILCDNSNLMIKLALDYLRCFCAVPYHGKLYVFGGESERSTKKVIRGKMELNKQAFW